jgi:hypothetical protein
MGVALIMEALCLAAYVAGWRNSVQPERERSE